MRPTWWHWTILILGVVMIVGGLSFYFYSSRDSSSLGTPYVGDGAADDVIPIAERARVQLPFWGGEPMAGLPPHARVTSLALDEDGVLWLGMSGHNGVAAYFSRSIVVFDRLNTLITDADITKVFVDSDNRKWVGTHRGHVYTFHNSQWRVLPTPKETWHITDILQGHDGTIWVAALGGGLWSYEGEAINRHFTSELDDGRVRSLAVDAEGRLFAAAERAVYVYDGQVWQNMSQEILGDAAVFVKTMLFGDAGDLLYMGTSEGLMVLGDGEIARYDTENSGLAHNDVAAIATDPAGNLWVAYRYGPRVMTEFDGEDWNDHELACGVRDMVYDPGDGTWLVASSDGLCIFDGQSSRVLPVLETDPREWWRLKSLQELAEEETVAVDIRTALWNHQHYIGKKISFVGQLRVGWETANLWDEEGHNLRISPYYHRELNGDELESVLRMAPPRSMYQESAYVRFVGYLESKGSYAHLGMLPFQLFITEVLPLE